MTNIELDQSLEATTTNISTSEKRGRKLITSQLDGNDDEEESDNDQEDDESEGKLQFSNAKGINSELDDDSSNGDVHEGDQVMLCVYEKVSRVKSKWKVFN